MMVLRSVRRFIALAVDLTPATPHGVALAAARLPQAGEIFVHITSRGLMQ
jgi:hypothetical protein